MASVFPLVLLQVSRTRTIIWRVEVEQLGIIMIPTCLLTKKLYCTTLINPTRITSSLPLQAYVDPIYLRRLIKTDFSCLSWFQRRIFVNLFGFKSFGFALHADMEYLSVRPLEKNLGDNQFRLLQSLAYHDWMDKVPAYQALFLSFFSRFSLL